MRICIDTRIRTGFHGGVEQFMIGLAHGLTHLPDGDEEYSFLVYPGSESWLTPFLGDAARLLYWRGTAVQGDGRWTLQTRVRNRLEQARRRLRLGRGEATWTLPQSDGVVEEAGADVVHFTHQSAFLTRVPFLYHPWDLQHRHLPEFFSPEDLAARELIYPAFARRAALVVAATDWSKRDFVSELGLAPAKIAVIPAPPVLGAYPVPSASDVSAARARLDLPEAFAFYPAQTWPHKNHLNLLEAIALLRDRDGLEVPLVCSGYQNAHYENIAARVGALRLEQQVRFVGFVSPLELQCLYRLSTMMVFPSLFEGWGFPPVEAFSTGVPLACSNATTLPGVVGDAGLLFDPNDVADMARAIGRLWTDPDLRDTLRKRGTEVVAQFDWEKTARMFRAHYRRIGKARLTPEDRALLKPQAGR